jgi:hypothetical protein
MIPVVVLLLLASCATPARLERPSSATEVDWQACQRQVAAELARPADLAVLGPLFAAGPGPTMGEAAVFGLLLQALFAPKDPETRRTYEHNGAMLRCLGRADADSPTVPHMRG